MLLLIDNYDSFTYNLYQYFNELGTEVRVVRNDKINIDAIRLLKPERIVISPGPSIPENAGISNDVIRCFGRTVPILGVCLGHQCIGYSYGGEIISASRIMHGKSSEITHYNEGVFKGIPNPFNAIRYHSLAIEPKSLPPDLEVTALSEDGTIMGVRHISHPVEGIQFHPESFMTQHGKQMLANFLKKEVPSYD